GNLALPDGGLQTTLDSVLFTRIHRRTDSRVLRSRFRFSNGRRGRHSRRFFLRLNGHRVAFSFGRVGRNILGNHAAKTVDPGYNKGPLLVALLMVWDTVWDTA